MDTTLQFTLWKLGKKKDAKNAGNQSVKIKYEPVRFLSHDGSDVNRGKKAIYHKNKKKSNSISDARGKKDLDNEEI